MRKITISGLVAVAAVLGSVIPAVTASAATTQATSVRLPRAAAAAAHPARAGADSATLMVMTGDRISCASPTACLAVGTNSDSAGNPTTPVAEALHGTAWKSVAVKAPAGATVTELTGVSCKAATYCLVVGEYADKQDSTHPAAWTWNGTALTPAAPPSMPGSAGLYQLSAVSCVAVKSCVAMGTAFGPSGAVQLIWTWNGKAWTRMTVTLPGNGAQAGSMTGLSAVHCFSLTSCEVAGMTDDFSGTSMTQSLLLAAWNGKAFTPQRAAAVGTTADFGLVTDLWCFSPSHCVVTGVNVSPDAKTTTMTGFAEVWNGTAWTVTKWAGPKGSTMAALFGVSCTSATSCVAVGAAGTEKVMQSAALSFNGTKWSVLKVPSAGRGLVSAFQGVSCPKTGDCVAIGEYGKSTQTAGKPLAGYWNGSAWKLKAA